MFIPVSFFETDSAAYSGKDIADFSGDTPRLVVSHRRINSSYSGNLVTLREDNGNTTQGFGSGLGMGEFIDWNAVDSWLTSNSATNAYYETWHDQSGNGNDITQTTLSKQHLVSTGSSVTLSPRSAYSDGVDDTLHHELSSGVFGATDCTMYLVFEAVDTGFSTMMAMSSSPTTAGGQTYFRGNRYGTNFRASWGGTQAQTTSTAAGAAEHYMVWFDGVNIQGSLDNGVATISAAETGTTGIDTFKIGSDDGSHFWEGYFHELVVFDADQGATERGEWFSEHNTVFGLGI